jgi:hypothetical protein
VGVLNPSLISDESKQKEEEVVDEQEEEEEVLSGSLFTHFSTPISLLPSNSHSPLSVLSASSPS